MLILVFAIIIILISIMISIPLYLLVNIFCWIFNISFHLTLFKAFALCVLINIVRIFILKTISIDVEKINDEEDKL